MSTKDYHMQVRVIADNDKVFEAATEVMKKEAQRVYALLKTLVGPGQPSPDIKIFSNDFMQSSKEEMQAGAAGQEKADASGNTPDDL